VWQLLARLERADVKMMELDAARQVLDAEEVGPGSPLFLLAASAGILTTS